MNKLLGSDLDNDKILDFTGSSTTNEVVNSYTYYPFGLMMGNNSPANNTTTPDTKYQYNDDRTIPKGRVRQCSKRGNALAAGWQFNSDLPVLTKCMEGLNLLDYSLSLWTQSVGSARWYDPAVGRFTSIDRYSEKYATMNPYQYGANNPVRFIDINGDSLGVNLFNANTQKAFNAFFSTKEGRQFLSQYAAKGQTINGYTFKSNGKFHNNGIDLAYSDRDFGKGKENIGGETTGGRNSGTFEDGRLKLGVSINTSAEESSLIDKAKTVTHESLLHVQEYSFDFSDNKKLDFSNNSFYQKTKNNSPDNRHHIMFHNDPNAALSHPFSTQGLRVLECVNSQNKLGYSRTQL